MRLMTRMLLSVLLLSAAVGSAMADTKGDITAAYQAWDAAFALMSLGESWSQFSGQFGGLDEVDRDLRYAANLASLSRAGPDGFTCRA